MVKYTIKNELDFESEICDYLKNVRKENPDRNLAIVLDIDDTMIYSNTKKSIKEIKKIYNSAKNNKITIFIITARFKNEFNIKHTRNELVSNGFGYFNRLFLMPYEYFLNNKIGLYKSQARNWISQKYQIILNIGDQWTDIYPHGALIKMPNKYYIIPDNLCGIHIKLVSKY